MVASLIGRTNRVLYLAMSPDGATIVTAQGMTGDDSDSQKREEWKKERE